MYLCDTSRYMDFYDFLILIWNYSDNVYGFCFSIYHYNEPYKIILQNAYRESMKYCGVVAPFNGVCV